MIDVFLPTKNYQKTVELITELIESPTGVEMGVVVGQAGRGKTTAAERIYTESKHAIYCLYQEGWNYLDLLREIAFRLSGQRPHFRQKCFEIIQNELAIMRRVIMVDEADRMPLKVLNGMRNIHDICNSGVVLIGEEALTSNLKRERRLISRIRNTVHFGPVQSQDVFIFFNQAVGVKLTPDQGNKILRHSQGDFRRVLTSAITVERLMKVNDIDGPNIPDKVVDEVVRNGNRN
jgi:DNA transposition AAA+ family ATPase